MPPPEKPYDFFISHASEQKSEMAIPIAEALEQKGRNVWLDKWELTLGDDLIEEINAALRDSIFGVLIFSREYFEKDWPKAEMKALLSRQINGVKCILPIRHEISHEEVKDRWPLLAPYLSASTEDGIPDGVGQIMRAWEKAQGIKPKDQSPADKPDNPFTTHYFDGKPVSLPRLLTKPPPFCNEIPDCGEVVFFQKRQPEDAMGRVARSPRGARRRAGRHGVWPESPPRQAGMFFLPPPPKANGGTE